MSENAVQSGSQIFVGTPKAHKQRTVPLPEFLLPYLGRQCEGRGRDELLFGGDDGRHLRRPHPTSGWFAKASRLSSRAITGFPFRNSVVSVGTSESIGVLWR